MKPITRICLSRLPKASLLVALGLIASCSPKKLPEYNSAHPILGHNCFWGTSQFDLCQYQSASDITSALLEKMTLKEKIGQMTQSVWHNQVSPKKIHRYKIGSIIHTDGPTPGTTAKQWRENFNRFQQQALKTRLGIPLVSAVDAVHGQNTFEGAVIFPHNIGMAASRNLELINQAAQITADETRATGFHWAFAPCISMPRHEYWGRVYEGYGEESEFTSAVASTSIIGFQKQQHGQIRGVAATAKHYLGDGASIDGKSGGNAVISEAELRQRYLPPYQAAIDANVASIMVGFNPVNGVNMHQNTLLVQNVLKDDLGFEGVVISDWNGGLRYGPPHTVINAGVDIAMQPGNHREFIRKLKRSVHAGQVSMSRIDDAVRRILELKLKLGVFKQPFFELDDNYEIGSAENRAVARKAVQESIVLLKNQPKSLPLNIDSKSLHVVGEHAHNTGLQSGGWTISWQGQTESYQGSTSILDGIREFVSDAEYHQQSCDQIDQAETIVVAVGEQPYAEYQGDSSELTLSKQQELLLESCAKKTDNLIVILVTGRPLQVNRALELASSFLVAWLPGSEGGGVADFLFAKNGFKPKGTLPHVWPKRIQDLPLEIGDQRALFPYAFGLKEFAH